MNLFEDVIDLTAKPFDLRLYDAAQKLASALHLAPDKLLPETLRQRAKDNISSAVRDVNNIAIDGMGPEQSHR